MASKDPMVKAMQQAAAAIANMGPGLADMTKTLSGIMNSGMKLVVPFPFLASLPNFMRFQVDYSRSICRRMFRLVGLSQQVFDGLDGSCEPVARSDLAWQARIRVGKADEPARMILLAGIGDARGVFRLRDCDRDVDTLSVRWADGQQHAWTQITGLLCKARDLYEAAD